MSIALIFLILPALFEPYEAVGFFDQSLHSAGTTTVHIPEAPGNIPAVELSVIREALGDQGYGAATAGALATQFSRELLTPVATATENPAIVSSHTPNPPAAFTLTPKVPSATSTGAKTKTPSPEPDLTQAPLVTRYFWIVTATETTRPAEQRTHTPTASATRTPSATPTQTTSPTASATQTATVTSTVTLTATATSTATTTFTPTPSQTASATASATQTATATSTFAPTAAATLTATATFTPTPTQTASATLHATTTASRTATLTPVPSVTVPAVATATPTATVTRAASATLTSSVTPTQTISISPTATISATALTTSTPIPTETLTQTPTSTTTSIPTPTRTSTPTPTPTQLPSATPAPTLPSTPVGEATPTATASPTSIPSFTPIPSQTRAPTETPTLEPSATPTREGCIDPNRIAGILPSDDTYIYHVKPGFNYGGETLIQIRPEYNGEMRGLLRFDLSAIPAGAMITSATLYLNAVDGNNGHVNSVYRVTTGWNEATATWTFPWNLPGGDFEDQTLIATFEIGASGCAIPVDLTGLVSAWVDGTYENEGILIRAVGPRSVAHYVSKEDVANPGLRPQLMIAYELP